MELQGGWQPPVLPLSCPPSRDSVDVGLCSAREELSWHGSSAQSTKADSSGTPPTPPVPILFSKIAPVDAPQRPPVDLPPPPPPPPSSAQTYMNRGFNPWGDMAGVGETDAACTVQPGVRDVRESCMKADREWVPPGKQLRSAAGKGESSTCEDLLQRSADVHDTDKAGKTALHYASRAGKLDVVSMLLKYRADPNAADVNSDRPADEADYWYVKGKLQNSQDADGCLAVRRLLLEHGGVRSPPEVHGQYEQMYVRRYNRLADEAAAIGLEVPWLHPSLLAISDAPPLQELPSIAAATTAGSREDTGEVWTRMEALEEWDNTEYGSEYLFLIKGELFMVRDRLEDGWAYGYSLLSNQYGWFPPAYMREIPS